MYITTHIYYNNYICTYTTKKNKMYSILFGLSILYGFLPILMDFSFFFFPSSYLGLLLLVFLVFPILFFFEKFLILCFCLNRFSIVVVFVFGWISFCFRLVVLIFVSMFRCDR